MARHERKTLTLRSAFVLKRLRELEKRTGMTAADIVEDALRGYVPPSEPVPVGRLVRRGPILVYRANGPKVTLDESNKAHNAVREREM